MFADTAPYDRRVSMPKWNGPISVRQDHRVFTRLPEFASWSRSQHAKAALAAAYASQHTTQQYLAAVKDTLAIYGDGSGVLISGIVRDHFPKPVKDRLRLLAHYATEQSDLSASHWQAAGRRLATWRRMREDVRS